MITKLGGEKGLTDAFLAAELSLVAVLASAYGLQAATRLRSEETSGRVEPLLSTATGRVRWAAGHIAVALAGTAVLLLVAGAGAGLAHGARVGDMGETWRVFGAAAAHIPAAWILVGIAVAAFGLVPRLTAVGWVAYAGFILLGEFGPLLRLDQWAMDLSPYIHVPRLPGSTLSATPLVVLTAVTVLLITCGVAGLRRRDID
jgi:ABC-2 type transport system permease protein